MIPSTILECLELLRSQERMACHRKTAVGPCPGTNEHPGRDLGAENKTEINIPEGLQVDLKDPGQLYKETIF